MRAQPRYDGASGISDMEGKVTRVGASKPGASYARTNYNPECPILTVSTNSAISVVQLRRDRVLRRQEKGLVCNRQAKREILCLTNRKAN